MSIQIFDPMAIAGILRRSSVRGFTLIELAIVLVIIGLLAGGVLVGRELIFHAQVTKAAKDIEELKTSLNTFKMKYGCWPGDCANVSPFLTGCASNCDGNANGVYDSAEEGSNRLFYHLQLAGLPFKGTYNNASTYNGNVFAGVNVPALSWPGTSGASGISLYVTDFNWDLPYWGPGCEAYQPWKLDSRNLFPGRKIVVDGIRPAGNNQFVCGYGGGTSGLARPLAVALDRKFDDGLPTSGHIQALVFYPFGSETCQDASGYLTSPAGITGSGWPDVCVLGFTVQ